MSTLLATGVGTALALGYQGGWVDPDTAQTNAHARWYEGPRTSSIRATKSNTGSK